MKKLLVAFSIFCLFVLASCSKLNEDDIFPETGSDTSDTGSSNNDTSNTHITDTGITDVDNDDIDDSDMTDSDNNDTTPEQPDTGDTSDTDISNTDITDSGADTGDSGADTGDSGADTGDSGADTGDSGADTGDSGADTGDSGADTGDSGADTGDTGADTGDTGADTGDTGADTGDTGADTGDSGADTGADEPHECSVDPATPCKAGNLIWSSRSANTVDWDTAKSKCASYSEGKFTSGWRLPKINELRKVMRNCTTTETGGNCGVTDECALKGTDINGIACYTNSACKKAFGDICSPSLEHSPFGETGKLWTALKTQDDPDWAWYVSFYNGEIAWAPDWTNDEIYYRCVHNIE